MIRNQTARLDIELATRWAEFKGANEISKGIGEFNKRHHESIEKIEADYHQRESAYERMGRQIEAIERQITATTDVEATKRLRMVQAANSGVIKDYERTSLSYEQQVTKRIGLEKRFTEFQSQQAELQTAKVRAEQEKQTAIRETHIQHGAAVGSSVGFWASAPVVGLGIEAFKSYEGVAATAAELQASLNLSQRAIAGYSNWIENNAADLLQKQSALYSGFQAALPRVGAANIQPYISGASMLANVSHQSLDTIVQGTAGSVSRFGLGTPAQINAFLNTLAYVGMHSGGPSGVSILSGTGAARFYQAGAAGGLDLNQLIGIAGGVLQSTPGTAGARTLTQMAPIVQRLLHPTAQMLKDIGDPGDRSLYNRLVNFQTFGLAGSLQNILALAGSSKFKDTNLASDFLGTGGVSVATAVVQSHPVSAGSIPSNYLASTFGAFKSTDAGKIKTTTAEIEDLNLAIGKALAPTVERDGKPIIGFLGALTAFGRENPQIAKPIFDTVSAVLGLSLAVKAVNFLNLVTGARLAAGAIGDITLALRVGYGAGGAGGLLPALVALAPGGAVGVAIAGVLALGAAFIVAYAKIKQFRDFVNRVMPLLPVAFVSPLALTITALRGFAPQFLDAGATFIKNLAKGIGDTAYSLLPTAMQKVIDDITTPIYNAAQTFVKAGESIGTQIVNGVLSVIPSWLRGFLHIPGSIGGPSGIPSGMTDALGNPISIGKTSKDPGYSAISGAMFGAGSQSHVEASGMLSGGIDQDFQASYGTPIFLPGDNSKQYKYLGTKKIPGVGNVEEWQTKNGGHMYFLHTSQSGLAGGGPLKEGAFYLGGTQVALSGGVPGKDGVQALDPKTGIGSTGAHFCVVTDANGRASLVTLTDSQISAANAAGQQLSSNVPNSITQWSSQLLSASNQSGIPAPVLAAIMMTESGGKNFQTSSAGAQGLMQVMPFNDKALGITNPFNPNQNIAGGATLLAQYYNGPAHHDLWTALVMYNGGPGIFQKGGKGLQDAKAYANSVMPLATSYGLTDPTLGSNASTGTNGFDPNLFNPPDTNSWPSSITDHAQTFNYASAMYGISPDLLMAIDAANGGKWSDKQIMAAAQKLSGIDKKSKTEQQALVKYGGKGFYGKIAWILAYHGSSSVPSDSGIKGASSGGWPKSVTDHAATFNYAASIYGVSPDLLMAIDVTSGGGTWSDKHIMQAAKKLAGIDQKSTSEQQALVAYGGKGYYGRIAYTLAQQGSSSVPTDADLKAVGNAQNKTKQETYQANADYWKWRVQADFGGIKDSKLTKSEKKTKEHETWMELRNQLYSGVEGVWDWWWHTLTDAQRHDADFIKLRKAKNEALWEAFNGQWNKAWRTIEGATSTTDASGRLQTLKILPDCAVNKKNHHELQKIAHHTGTAAHNAAQNAKDVALGVFGIKQVAQHAGGAAHHAAQNAKHVAQTAQNTHQLVKHARNTDHNTKQLHLDLKQIIALLKKSGGSVGSAAEQAANNGVVFLNTQGH